MGGEQALLPILLTRTLVADLACEERPVDAAAVVAAAWPVLVRGGLWGLDTA